MGRIKRYRTALARYQHSKGFGIHSPFAFGFVLTVLRERNPYYCYTGLHELRRMVIDRTSRHFRHPRVISFKSAKMIFRITNHFNPALILQIGTSYGVSTASMLTVSGQSRLVLCEARLGEFPVTHDVLERYRNRISHFRDVGAAITHYSGRLDGADPYVLVNCVADDAEYSATISYLATVMRDRGVVIMRNLSRNDKMKELWRECKSMAVHGMTFSNEKTAVLVVDPKLPRQDFLLWF